MISALGLLAHCNDDPATAALTNGYPSLDGGAGEVVVYKAWWSSTLFDTPISPGATSASLRTVTATDTAYALLAPGWDPTSSAPPTSLVVVRSKAKDAVVRGDSLSIVVSPATFSGDCTAHDPISQQDADFVTSRVFPGDFSGFTYDAKTCSLAPIPADAGTD